MGIRNIIFRGKRKDTSKWAEGFPYITQKGECEISWYSKDYNIERMTTVVIPESFGEFTGLFDKNGKKIFEGDIIKSEQWYNCGCYPHTEIRSFAVKIPDIYQKDIESVEVIGNIHDNPELLKGGDTNE